MTNEKKRHHYVPEMYLKRWCDARRELWAYHKDPKAGLLDNKRSPKATGWHPDLYKLTEGSVYSLTKDPDGVENFFSKELEDRAEPLVEKLIQGEKLDALERITFIRYIRSFSLRHLYAVEKILAEAECHYDNTIEILRDKIDSSDEDFYIRQQKTLDAIKRDRSVARNTALGMISLMLNDPKADEHYSKMKILTMKIESPLVLVTSNSPLLINGRIRTADFGTVDALELLEIAISPHHLCFLGPWLSRYSTEDLVKLMISFNVRMVKSGPDVIYASQRLSPATSIISEDTLRTELPETELFRKYQRRSKR